MAFPSVTYTFVNGTSSDGTQVNQNFTDLINSLSDGTKSLSINAITCAGTATLNGAVTLGDSTVDDITIGGSIAASIPVKTTNSYDLGSATFAFKSLYLADAGSAARAIRLLGATIASSYTFTFPTTAGTASYGMVNLGNGSMSFLPPPINTITNYSLVASVGSSALTVSLKGADGNDASNTNPIYIPFRSSTATTGTPVFRTVTAALSVVVSSGSTLGHASAQNQYIYIYAIDSAGTIELAVSSIRIYDEASLQTTVAEGGAGAADGTSLYSTTQRSNVPCRLLGRIKSNQATAGTWATSPSEISIHLSSKFSQSRSTVRLRGTNGFGTTSRIRRFSTTIINIGSDITYTDNSTNDGATFTINTDGIYAMSYTDSRGAGNGAHGFSLNTSEKNTNIQALTVPGDRLMYTYNDSGGIDYNCSTTELLRAGDVVRPHADNLCDSPNVTFTITRVSE